MKKWRARLEEGKYSILDREGNIIGEIDYDKKIKRYYFSLVSNSKSKQTMTKEEFEKIIEMI